MGADLSLNPLEENIQEAVEDILNGKPEVIIECVGTSLTQEQLVKLIKPGGKVIWFRVADPENKIR